MALTCPHCAAAMREVRAEALAGYLIVLDQCPQCGGIWCDRWELYPITAAAAERLDRVDRDALRQSTELPQRPLECPRCRARLFRFNDSSLPADARIERCPNCDGMWFNRGELRRVKARRTAGAAGAPTAGDETMSDAQVADLATRALGVVPGPLPTIRSLDDFDTPQHADVSPQDLRQELKASAGWLIARAILRLLLHI